MPAAAMADVPVSTRARSTLSRERQASAGRNGSQVAVQSAVRKDIWT